MTEYEILDLVASDSAQMASQFNIYLTVLSAYLLIAYFAGNKLTKVQTGILTMLFIWACGAQILGMNLTLQHVLQLFERKAEIVPLSSYEMTYAGHTHLWMAAMGVALLAGLFFMWNTRRQKAD